MQDLRRKHRLRAGLRFIQQLIFCDIFLHQSTLSCPPNEHLRKEDCAGEKQQASEHQERSLNICKAGLKEIDVMAEISVQVPPA